MNSYVAPYMIALYRELYKYSDFDDVLSEVDGNIVIAENVPPTHLFTILTAKYLLYLKLYRALDRTPVSAANHIYLYCSVKNITLTLKQQ